MANGEDNKQSTLSRKQKRQLSSTKKCYGNRCFASDKGSAKPILPSKEIPSWKEAPKQRASKKVRYERTFQQGKPVDLPKLTDDDKVVHTEEQYALYEKTKGAASEKDVKDIEQMNKERKIETKTVKVEPKKTPQYTGAKATGFKTTTQKRLDEERSGKKRPAFIKTSEGFKRDSPTDKEYKFRSTREDENTRVVAKYEKDGSGEVKTIDKEKRGEVYRSMSHRQKKKLRGMTQEKRDKKYERKGALKREKF